jgi:hypothetical protein
LSKSEWEREREKWKIHLGKNQSHYYADDATNDERRNMWGRVTEMRAGKEEEAFVVNNGLYVSYGGGFF